jgi:tRNA threonylcarbamoyladenosine biosynthesis protein TsaB
MSLVLPEPCLVLDGSARQGTSVGILQDGRWLSQVQVEQGAMEASVDAVQTVLQAAGLSLADLKSFAVCIGPGSILGIRLTAMAVRTWAAQTPRPLYTWDALTVLARVALQAKRPSPFLVVSDSRLKRWNVLKVNDATSLSAIAELTVDEVKSQGLPLISTSASSRDVFPEVEIVPSVWAHLPALLPLVAIANSKPEALNPTNDFALWSGERHRGPV